MVVDSLVGFWATMESSDWFVALSAGAQATCSLTTASGAGVVAVSVVGGRGGSTTTRIGMVVDSSVCCETTVGSKDWLLAL